MNFRKSFIIAFSEIQRISPLDIGFEAVIDCQRLERKAMSAGKTQKQSIDPDAIYSREEAAEALGISLSTLKKLINAGYLRVSQPAGIRRIFIKGESILAMLDETVVERRA